MVPQHAGTGPADRPDAAALLRAALELRLSDSPGSEDVLTAALKTLCDELQAGGRGAEQLVLMVRGAWRSATRPLLLTDEMSQHLYGAVLHQALTIYFAESR